MVLSHRLALLPLALASIVTLATAQQLPYEDTKLSAAVRAHDLVGRMTLEEKANQLEDWATAIPRLGIPDYQTWNEALHGVARAGYATVFPQAIGMAATWDPAMVHSMGNVISTEARAKYNQAQRRGQSPHLLRADLLVAEHQHLSRSALGTRAGDVRRRSVSDVAGWAWPLSHGVQGDDLDHLRAVATSKHFAVHSGPEPLRHGFNVDPSARDLEETYLPAFRATVTEGHVQSVMCAYNSIDELAGLHQQDAAQGASARRVGIQGVCGLRLRRDCGREPGAQEDA